jgi:SagB-type dehydrogenase family enzyme
LKKPIEGEDRPGDHFQEATKYVRGKRLLSSPDLGTPPEAYKRYDKAISLIQLPAPDTSSAAPLWPSIARRRSERHYSAEPLTLQELSQLLWASQGVTAQQGDYAFRAAPSAGALYPVETYLVVNRVTGLRPGVYHYRIVGHKLELIREGEFGGQLAEAALGQQMCARAPVVFVWTSIIKRSSWKYGQRAYRYTYLDAGHIAAHVSLAAVALGLSTCQIGAFYDEEVNAVVQVDGKEEFAIYMTSVGHV